MERTDISRLRLEKRSGPGRFENKRKYFYWSAAALATVLIFLFASGVFSPPEVRVGSVTMTYPSQGVTVLNSSGYVVAERKAALASKTTGRLVWLGVEEGSKVKRGEVVARLENEDLSAAREESLAALKASRENQGVARAELEDAKSDFLRKKELFENGFISRSAFDAALARHEKARSSFDAAKAQVNAAQAGVKGAEASLGYTYIKAPFEGVVLTKNADLGDIITPLGAAANAKAAVVTIADMDSLLVETDVSESNIGKVAIKMDCEIQLDALPAERFKGRVHMIVPTADRTKASVLVKVHFMEKDPRILPEMSAKVSFLSRPLNENEKAPRTTVPETSIVNENGQKAVFVLEGDKAVKRPVNTASRIGDMVEVVSGAKEGEAIVLNPPKGLSSGSRVKALEE